MASAKENVTGSPFPGMDPCLEGEMWQEFHERLANQISVQLLPLITRNHVALLAKRYVLDRSLGIHDVPAKQPIHPDVHAVKPGRPASSMPAGGPAAGGAALALSEPAAELPNIEEVPQVAVEIRDIAPRRQITVTEILSTANKYGDGARQYEDRRLDLLKTRNQILEIDLLRGGKRIQLAGEPPPAHYCVYPSRVERRPNTQVWAVSLRDRLPAVPVPLAAPDADVALHLQEAVGACCRLVGHERLLDYSTASLPPRLAPEDSAWTEEILKAAQKRL